MGLGVTVVRIVFFVRFVGVPFLLLNVFNTLLFIAIHHFTLSGRSLFVCLLLLSSLSMRMFLCQLVYFKKKKSSDKMVLHKEN